MAGAEGLLQLKVKLGEALICGESCWLLPLPLVPLLKLLMRDRALSEAEVGSPLEGMRNRRLSSAWWGGAPFRQPSVLPPSLSSHSPGTQH